MAPPERPRRAPRSPQNRTGAPRPRTGAGKPPYKRRDDADGPKKPYARRADGDPPKKPYGRRGDADTPKKPYARRDDSERKPYPRRDRDARPPRAEAPARPPWEDERKPKKWGNVTRRGARQVVNPTPMSDEAKAYEKREFSRSGRPEVDRWERTDAPAPRAPRKASAKRPAPRAKSLPPAVVAEVASASANARRAPMLQKRLGDAARHIQHGREREAASVLRQLAQEVPEAASVRELYGQALYALGRYRQAINELEAFVELTGSTEQHPMLADSYRAVGRHNKVRDLWAEVREASPSPDVVAEGRIVMAGSLGDQGKLNEAVKLLETAPPVRGRVADRHMRTWYALADLYERSGELGKARALFRRVVQHDAEFADAADRLRALG